MAEVFGNQKGVQFDYQISARVSVVAGSEWANFQVKDGMEFDCLIGEDIMQRAELIIDNRNRTAGSTHMSQRMLIRGEVLSLMMRIEDFYQDA